MEQLVFLSTLHFYCVKKLLMARKSDNYLAIGIMEMLGFWKAMEEKSCEKLHGMKLILIWKSTPLLIFLNILTL